MCTYISVYLCEPQVIAMFMVIGIIPATVIILMEVIKNGARLRALVIDKLCYDEMSGVALCGHKHL